MTTQTTTQNQQKTSLVNAIKWFDPRWRKLGTWAFILNRITALGLTLYLFMHLLVLGQLAIGEQAYQGFLTLAAHPVVKVGEFLVVSAGLIHGLNGIRIALTSFGIGVPYQKQMFLGFMALAGIGCIAVAYKLFLG